MNKAKFHILLILILWSLCSPFGLAQQNTRKYILASGEKLGLYNKTASFIESISMDLLKSGKILNLTTKGSLENIERLKDGIADFAIIQRNVALRYYYHPQNPFKKFEVVMPLFPEALQIFVNGNTGIMDFNHFIRKIKEKEIKTIAIGSPGTDSNISIRLILNLFGLDQSSVILDQRKFSLSFRDFNNGKIDCWATIIGFPFIPVLNDKDLTNRIAIVSMSQNEIRYILSRISYLEEVQIPPSIYPMTGDGEPVMGVGTWAFLIARTGVMDQIENVLQVKGKLFIVKIARAAQQGGSKSQLLHMKTFGMGGEFEFLANEKPPPSSQFYDRYSYFFRNLPLSSALESVFIRPKIPLLTGFIMIIFAVGTIFLLIRYRGRIDYYKYWLRYKHFIFSALFLVIGFFVFAKLVHALETNFYKTYSVKSGIVDLSIFDVQIWLLVFVLTGVNNDVFPLSLGGRIVATAAAYIGWLAAIFTVIGEFVSAMNKKKRRLGMKKNTLNGHLCICGWNESAPQLIKKSLFVQKSSFINKKRKIVVITPKFKEYLEKDLILKKHHDRHEIEFINGEPRDVDSLILSNIIDAKTVVLLAEERSEEADEKTLLRALAISRYVRQVKNKSMDSIYTIAEINNPKFQSSLSDADVNEVICSPHVGKNLIIQSMFCHGVANFINSVIFFNKGNEFYIIDISQSPSLTGKTYDELLVLLRVAAIQLIGIKITFRDNQGRAIIDRAAINRGLDKLGISREYIINPHEHKEICYKTTPGDQLLVLALDEKKTKNIEKALKRIKPSHKSVN